jgi:two-component system, OmpR family, sensor histidine kinase KdpD
VNTAGSPPEWTGYAWGALAVTACTAFCGLVQGYLERSSLVMVNLLSVVGVSMRFGFGASLFTAALSALAFDFFFIPPVFAFAPSDLRSAATLVVMVVVAGVISGLAEQARRQRRIAQTRELTLETERLRNSLLSAVSHDLRTPLAAIYGAGTELLEDATRLTAIERDELAQSIVEEAARLDQAVTNLLDLARLDGGPPQIGKTQEPLDEVVEAALTRLGGRLQARPVLTRVPQEIPMVAVDAMLIEHVLVNLLENALKYSPAGTPVEIEASRSPGAVVVEVRDRGAGIADSEAEKLFERFYRGAAQPGLDGGVGLGLTICRAIMKAHGGTIALSNRDGGGAVARLTFPVESEQSH